MDEAGTFRQDKLPEPVTLEEIRIALANHYTRMRPPLTLPLAERRVALLRMSITALERRLLGPPSETSSGMVC